jgi:hypothetical protein
LLLSGTRCGVYLPPSCPREIRGNEAIDRDLLKHATVEAWKRLEIRDYEEPGLIFRVTDKGAGSWSLRYVNAVGEHRRKSIGPYSAVSLSKAREEARKIKGAVAGGADVVGLEQAHKAAAAGQKLHRLDDLAGAYFEAAARGLHKINAKGPKRQSTIMEERRIYDRFVSPALIPFRFRDQSQRCAGARLVGIECVRCERPPVPLGWAGRFSTIPSAARSSSPSRSMRLP